MIGLSCQHKQTNNSKHDSGKEEKANVVANPVQGHTALVLHLNAIVFPGVLAL